MIRILFFALFLTSANAIFNLIGSDQYVTVTGRLICDGQPASDVLVKLYEDGTSKFDWKFFFESFGIPWWVATFSGKHLWRFNTIIKKSICSLEVGMSARGSSHWNSNYFSSLRHKARLNKNQLRWNIQSLWTLYKSFWYGSESEYLS